LRQQKILESLPRLVHSKFSIIQQPVANWRQFLRLRDKRQIFNKKIQEKEEVFCGQVDKNKEKREKSSTKE